MADATVPRGAAKRIVRRPPFGNNPRVGERGTDTQRRILAAALDVFAEVGFHDARVELIADKAACSRPAFYQYFSSKDDVFWKLAAQLGDEMVALGDRLGPVTPDRPGVVALAEWLDEFATLYEAYAPVFSAFQAASRDHKPLAKGSSKISDRLGDALVRAFEAHPPELEAHGLARAIVAVLIRCFFYSLGFEQAVERRRLVDGLAQFLHRLLAGPIDGVNTNGNGPRRRPPVVAPSAPPLGDGARALRPRGQKTRQRLLDAGAVVLPARGYYDARVDDIVAAAGVSHGSFYRYFENKDAFFRVLADEASARMIELLDVFPDPTDATALRNWLDDWLGAYQSNGGVISTWQEMQGDDPELLAFSQEVAASVVGRLMGILGGRGFGDDLVDALALLAVIERVPYSVFTLRFTEAAEAIDAMVLILRRGFMGVAGASG